MSSRQLRKLQQQRELEQAKLNAQEEEESEEEPVVHSKTKASLFANLAALEDEANEQEESAEEEEVKPKQNDLTEDPAPTSASKKHKKSKKKKKAKKGKEIAANDAEQANDADDIDAALRELNIKQSTSKAKEPAAPAVDPEYQRVCTLLGINTQHLKVANEMRNLFGKGVTDTHEDAGGSVGRGARRRQRGQQRQIDLETALKGQHAPGKGLPEVTLRRNALVQGKEDWPKATTGGLTMEMVDDKATDGTVEFRFAHNQSYQALQEAFQGYVEMGDPQNLIGLLQRNPYHISLLIQVSKIAKDQTDHALSADLLERALFSFGRAATTLFNLKLSQGKARLDFARPENRELWLAGYQYIKALVMKGTYRTALEWAKLLLSLDPEGDPYSMRLLIHNLAIRGHEFQWLGELYQSKLPEIWSAERPKQTDLLSHTAPSLAYASMQLKESTKCRELLAKAMQETPWLFVRLFKELTLDAPSTIWGIMPRSDAETLFSELYVLQTKDLWNTPAATALLMEIAHTISKVDDKSIPKLDNSAMTLDVVRYIYLDNNPAVMRYAPSDLLHRSNNSDADPLPPEDNIFSYESQRRAIEGRDEPRGGFGDDFFDPLAALARLMPQLRRRPPAQRDHDDDSDDESEVFDDETIRRELEEVVAEGNATEEGQASAPVSIAQRLLNMFWPARGANDHHSEEEAEDDEETDDEMPDLVDGPR